MDRKSSSFTTAALSAFTRNNYFLADFLYKELASESQNFLISPLSVQVTGALFQCCCKQETAEEIQTSLKLPSEIKELECCIRHAFPVLNSQATQELKFNCIKKLFVGQNIVVNKELIKAFRNLYRAEVDIVNFSDSFQAAQNINKWIQDKTADPNPELVKANSLGSGTRMIGISLIFFKSLFHKRFTKAVSKLMNFYKTPKETIQVRTMRVTDMFNYCSNKDLKAQFLEIPFEGEEIVMTIVLPRDVNGINDLEKKIANILDPQDFINERVEVSIPCFRFASNIDMKILLQKLGIKKLFTKNANISGIVCEKGGIYINELLQKTYFEMNEDGAGVEQTSTIKLTAKTSRFSPRYEKFKADHPFIFYIKEKEIVYLIGKVANPV